jgi:hypothetical protein
MDGFGMENNDVFDVQDFTHQNLIFRVKVHAGGVPFVFHGIHGLAPKVARYSRAARTR